MKTNHSNSEQQPAPAAKAKKLPMNKDAQFLAALRKQIIEDHNRKIDAKLKKERR